MAGDAACFIDPVFSTGVHLASLAGYLGATTAIAVVRGEAEEAEACAAYEARYRAAFERYLRFLYFFYDHNEDPDSYFWTARRLLGHAPAEIDSRTGFVRLMSGNADWHAMPEMVAREQDRFAHAIKVGRTAAMPGNELLRVRTTRQLMGSPY